MTGPTGNDTDASDESGEPATGRSSRFDDLVDQIDDEDDDSQRPDTDTATATANSASTDPPLPDDSDPDDHGEQPFDSDERLPDGDPTPDEPRPTDADLPTGDDLPTAEDPPPDDDLPTAEDPPPDDEEPPTGPNFMQQSRQRTAPSRATPTDGSLSLRRKIQLGLLVLFAAILIISLAVELTG